MVWKDIGKVMLSFIFRANTIDIKYLRNEMVQHVNVVVGTKILKSVVFFLCSCPDDYLNSVLYLLTTSNMGWMHNV